MNIRFAMAHKDLRQHLKSVCLLMLLCSIIAPKASLALASVLGDGYRSVVVCTGSGLIRVTVAPDGSVTDDDATSAWVSPHCVPSSGDVAQLDRAWQCTGFPALQVVRTHVDEVSASLPRLASIASGIRGPPPGSTV